MSLKFKDEIDFATIDNLMEIDGNRWKCWLWVFMFDLQHKKKGCSRFRFFLLFLKKYEEEKLGIICFL
jgi:hypothetical protein